MQVDHCCDSRGRPRPSMGPWLHDSRTTAAQEVGGRPRDRTSVSGPTLLLVADAGFHEAARCRETRVMEPGEVAVDLKEMARLMSISASTLNRYAAQGLVPSFRVGRSYRFFPSEVVEHLRTPVLPKPANPWGLSERSHILRPNSDSWARSPRSRAARRRKD